MITRRFGRGASLVFAENVVVAIVGLLYYILLAKLLPLEDLGILSFLTFIITILGLLMNLSISTVSAQRISTTRGKGKPEEIPSISKSSLQLVLILVSIFFTIGIISAFLFQPVIDVVLIIPLILTPAVGSFRVLYFSFLIGLERFGLKSTLAIIVFSATKFIGISLLFYFGLGIIGIIIGWLIGELVVLILCLSFGKIPIRGGERLSLSNLLWSGLAISTILFLYSFFDYIDRLIYFFGGGNLAGLGVYELTIRLLGPLVSFTLVISSVSLPILSHTFSKDSNASREFIGTLMRFYLILFLPLNIFLALTLQGQLLFIVYGTIWSGMEIVYRILIISSFFQGLLLLGVMLLQAIGGRNVFFKISIPVFVLDVIFTWAIIPFWGAVGIALVRLGSYATASILIIYVIWRHIQPEISLHWAGRLSLFLVSIALTVLILNFLPCIPIQLFLIQSFVVFIQFFVCIRIFNLISEEDKSQLISTFPFLRRIIKSWI